MKNRLKKASKKFASAGGRGGAKVDAAPGGFDYARPVDDEAEIIVKTLEYKPMDAEEAG